MTYNYEGVKKAVYDLLVAVGEDPERQGLLETPDRMARAYKQLLEGMGQDPSVHLEKQFDLEKFEGQDEDDSFVIVKDIEFYSCCEHHMLPFYGLAHICYIPRDGKITGLSKLARLVDGYARRLQVQERLTNQIAQAFIEKLDAKGVLVVVEAKHMCMSMRGVEKMNSKTITTASRGILKDKSRRAEAMNLIRSGE